MSDGHPNHEEDQSGTSDSSLQRRKSYSNSSDPRPDGKRGEGVATNGAGSPNRDGLSGQDEVVEGEILDEVSDRLTNRLLLSLIHI